MNKHRNNPVVMQIMGGWGSGFFDCGWKSSLLLLYSLLPLQVMG
jgi:hypothetical protein